MITVYKYYKSKQRSNHLFTITTWLELLNLYQYKFINYVSQSLI